jgi:transcriptional regulator with XRE-family HTH domain
MELPRLAELRYARLLTQGQLAHESGVSRVTIARIEAGGGTRPATAHRLATALHVDPEELQHHAPTTAAMFDLLAAFVGVRQDVWLPVFEEVARSPGYDAGEIELSGITSTLERWLKATDRLLRTAQPPKTEQLRDAMKVAVDRLAKLLVDDDAERAQGGH